MSTSGGSLLLPRQAPDQDRETHEKTRFKVLFRASAPLINVSTVYEKDGLTPWCIFADGISRTVGTTEKDNDFTLWYGGADTVVGARRVVVTIAGS